jgi:hypothetical protein
MGHPRFVFFSYCSELLQRAADLRENAAGVRADQADRPYHDDEYDRQHHRVFGDILAGLVRPKFAQPGLVRKKIAE